MPYTGDPENVPTDAVRVLVGDVGATPVLDDATIAFLLAEEGGNTLRAAARAAEALAAIYAQKSEERRVGPLWLRSFSDQSKKFLNLAKALWARAARAGSSAGVPWAGGISIADKNTRIADTDRVRPAFRRHMMGFDRSLNNSTSADELLSPEETLP